MVKQKHHTARNQSIKNHKNGIKKPLRQRYRSMKGVCGFVVVSLCRLILSSLETFVTRRSTTRRNKPYFDDIRGTISITCLFDTCERREVDFTCIREKSGRFHFGEVCVVRK